MFVRGVVSVLHRRLEMSYNNADDNKALLVWFFFPLLLIFARVLTHVDG